MSVLSFFSSSKKKKSKYIDQVATEVLAKISDEKVALQFILEELDSARYGGEIGRDFRHRSGFHKVNYKGAMKKSFSDVDGLWGPQLTLLSSLIELPIDTKDKVHVRVAVDEIVIAKWDLKKFISDETLFVKNDDWEIK